MSINERLSIAIHRHRGMDSTEAGRGGGGERHGERKLIQFNELYMKAELRWQRRERSLIFDIITLQHDDLTTFTSSPAIEAIVQQQLPASLVAACSLPSLRSLPLLLCVKKTLEKKERSKV